jgi:hypothetical protein
MKSLKVSASKSWTSDAHAVAAAAKASNEYLIFTKREEKEGD